MSTEQRWIEIVFLVQEMDERDSMLTGIRQRGIIMGNVYFSVCLNYRGMSSRSLRKWVGE